jgi:hypothetical protein
MPDFRQPGVKALHGFKVFSVNVGLSELDLLCTHACI